jgi:hypothetical protein
LNIELVDIIVIVLIIIIIIIITTTTTTIIIIIIIIIIARNKLRENACRVFIGNIEGKRCMGEVSMGGYLPHINRLFVVFTHCTRSCTRNTTISQLHAMDAIVPLARSFSSRTWCHWSLRRCQCDKSSALCEDATGDFGDEDVDGKIILKGMLWGVDGLLSIR